jgi:hypothetical protein
MIFTAVQFQDAFNLSIVVLFERESAGTAGETIENLRRGLALSR